MTQDATLTNVINISGISENFLSYFEMFDAVALFRTCKSTAISSVSKNHLNEMECQIVRDVLCFLNNCDVRVFEKSSVAVQTYQCMWQYDLEFLDFVQFAFKEANRYYDDEQEERAQGIIKSLLQSKSGLTNVSVATMTENVSALEFLIQIGATVESSEAHTPSPLRMICKSYPNVGIVKALLRAGASVRPKFGQSSPLACLLQLISERIYKNGYRDSQEYCDAQVCIKLLTDAGDDPRKLETKHRSLLETEM